MKQQKQLQGLVRQPYFFLDLRNSPQEQRDVRRHLYLPVKQPFQDLFLTTSSAGVKTPHRTAAVARAGFASFYERVVHPPRGVKQGIKFGLTDWKNSILKPVIASLPQMAYLPRHLAFFPLFLLLNVFLATLVGNFSLFVFFEHLGIYCKTGYWL